MTFRVPAIVSGLILIIMAASAFGKEPVSSVIDPDHGVYGVAFGATEKQLIDKLGEPSGTIQLSSTRRALVYGKKHAFIFRKGVFRGLIVSNFILDYDLVQGMEPHPVVDSITWTLVPGIKEGMSYAQVSKLVGRPAATGDYHLMYETADARVNLQFSGSEGSRRDPEGFTLFGFVIEHSP